MTPRQDATAPPPDDAAPDGRGTAAGAARHAVGPDRLALIAARTDNAVILTDADGRIQWVNEGFTRITGRALDDVVGRKPGEFLQGPDTSPATIAYMREQLAKGEGFTTEVLNYDTTGRKYWLHVEVQPIRDEQGRVTNFMAIESDITARKMTERRLAVQYSVARALSESDGVGEVGRHVLQTVCSALGWQFGAIWSADRASGTLVCLDTWSDPARRLEGFEAMTRAAVFADGVGLPGRVWRSGHAAWIRDVTQDPNFPRAPLAAAEGLRGAVAFPIRAGSEIVGVIECFSAEVEEPDDDAAQMVESAGRQLGQYFRRASDHDALRESEARKSAILEAALDCIITMDHRGNVVEFNPAAEQAFGYAESDVVGRPLAELIVPPALREQHQAGLARYLQTGEGPVLGKRIEVPAVRRDGTEFPVELAISVIHRPGAPLFTAYLRDVSVRKEYERELEAARCRAEEADRAKSSFLANMSHEIRTPMNAVIGMTSLLLDTPLTADQQEFVSTIRRGGETLLAITNDILDFSKIEAGRLDLDHSRFLVRECVESACDLAAHDAKRKGLALDIRIGDDVPPAVVGDVTRLRQVLANLIINAVKFTERGRVDVEVSARRLDGTEIELACAVRDTGIGIPASRMDRLFQTFSQVDRSTTRHYGGTGLGLAISRRLCELMGGRMWAESEEGLGATFSFTIRTHADASGADQPSGLDARLGVDKGLGARLPLRVLLVEDNPINQRVALLMLARMGYDADVASNGRQAVEALARQPYDLVLMDVQMPEMDGIDATRAIRRAHADPRQPWIVGTTAGATTEDREQSLAAGMNDYLSKPVQISDLQRAIERCGRDRLG